MGRGLSRLLAQKPGITSEIPATGKGTDAAPAGPRRQTRRDPARPRRVPAGTPGVGFVAKQDAIARLDGIVDYLQFLAVAKPNDIDPATPVPLSSLP